MPSSAEPIELSIACACANSRRVARLLTQLYDSRLRECGIEAPQFALLLALDNEGSCNQSDLGRRFALDKTTVSRNLKILERRGWISSQRGKDKRERLFFLSQSGKERVAMTRPAWEKAQKELRVALSDSKWDAMAETFRVVSAATAELI